MVSSAKDVSLHDGPYELDPQSFSLITSTPWSRDLLSNPFFRLVENSARRLKPDGENALFAKVLHTADTIRSCLSFYNGASATAPSASREAYSVATLPEACMILHLGPETNGFVKVCHGGMVAILIDEVMGLLMQCQKDVKSPPMTAKLQVTYKKPLPTPALVLARARLAQREGRKFFLTAEIEDGSGIVFAEAEGLFVEAKAHL